MHEILGQYPVVGQEEKSFALLVETADMEKVPCVGGEQVENGALSVLVTPGAGVAGGFVEQYRPGSKGMNDASTQSHIILRQDTRREIAADGTINGDASLKDQFLTGAAGSKACRR
jgi:hypothetical protein